MRQPPLGQVERGVGRPSQREIERGVCHERSPKRLFAPRASAQARPRCLRVAKTVAGTRPTDDVLSLELLRDERSRHFRPADHAIHRIPVVVAVGVVPLLVKKLDSIHPVAQAVKIVALVALAGAPVQRRQHLVVSAPRKVHDSICHEPAVESLKRRDQIACVSSGWRQ
eukprot:3009769-Prymnesium_polylepis.1